MTRILSALLLGGMTVAMVWYAPAPAAAAVVALVALLGAREMAGLLSGGEVPALLLAGGAVLTALGALGGLAGLNASFLAAVALAFGWRVLKGQFEGARAAVSAYTLAVLLPAWSLSHALLFLQRPSGRGALLLVLAVVWACDIAAYYGGTAFGRRKLARRVSPNKTVEGLLFGLAGGAAAAALLRSWLIPGTSMPIALAGGFLVSAVGQLGDLAESLVKRDAGVKDSGSVIPGHGGLLDRVDALLFSLPLSYYGFCLLEIGGP